VGELDGEWEVRRQGGLLPPLFGVRKRISGTRGETRVAGVGVPFDVVGRELRYRGVLQGLVDVLEPSGQDWLGRAIYRGRQSGRFRLTRRGQPANEARG
jgi:hypothetical protein